MVTMPIMQSAAQLQQQVSGRVILPADAAYERVRRGWNLLIDHHPAVILVAQQVQDVVAGIRFAEAAHLGVAIQSTGHGIQHPADDHLLIITSQMQGVRVDATARTARVEAGVVWQQVIEAATPHGLAPLLGSSPYVGVMGYTLGGGIGWLARRYGLAADSVRELEIVTADGVLRHASPTENSELFWGVRGGGGNFGVVTAMEINLYPVANLYGGNLIYSGATARAALGFFRDWVKTLPDELTSSIAIVKFPNLPQMPEALRGQIQVIVRAAYLGEQAAGEAYIQRWLDWHTPQVNTFRWMPFSDIGTISNDPVNPTAGFGSNEMFAELSDEALDIMVHHATNPASPLVMTELRHAGGAICTTADVNAVGNRAANFYFQIGGPIFTPEGKAISAAYIQRYKADLKPYFLGGVYQNFMSGSEAADRAQDAYSPAAYQRLIALKTTYDPHNRFRFSYQLIKAER